MSAREQPRALFSFFICIYRFFCVPLQPKVAKMMNESLLLRARIGRGYSRPNLNNMRKYYLLFPKCQTTDKLVANFQTSDKLTWSNMPHTAWTATSLFPNTNFSCPTKPNGARW